MDRAMQERIEAAPDRILVDVKQKHIDQGGTKWSLLDNPISLALVDIGWPDSSISTFNAFIGHAEKVGYKPELETSAQIDKMRAGGRMTPFIAGFKKEKP